MKFKRMKTNIKDIKKQAPPPSEDDEHITDHLSFISNTQGLPSYHHKSKEESKNQPPLSHFLNESEIDNAIKNPRTRSRRNDKRHLNAFDSRSKLK